jgi:hypothetical protein
VLPHDPTTTPRRDRLADGDAGSYARLVTSRRIPLRAALAAMACLAFPSCYASEPGLADEDADTAHDTVHDTGREDTRDIADDGPVDTAGDPCRSAPPASLLHWNTAPGASAGLINVRIEGDAVWGPIPPGTGPESTVEVPFDPWGAGLLRLIEPEGEGEVFVPVADLWLTRVDVDVWTDVPSAGPDCELRLAVHDLDDSGSLVTPARATVRLPCSSLPAYDGIRSPDVSSTFLLDEPVRLPGGRPVAVLLISPGSVVAGIRMDDPLAEGSYFIEGEPWPLPGSLAGWDLGFTAYVAATSGPPVEGRATTVAVIPDELAAWHSLAWTTLGPPGRIRAVLLYQPEVGFVPVPDELFPGNSAGFATSPLDLCGLDPARVPSLMVQMIFEPAEDGREAGLASWDLGWLAR